jgi:hypothetical protein
MIEFKHGIFSLLVCVIFNSLACHSHAAAMNGLLIAFLDSKVSTFHV